MRKTFKYIFTAAAALLIGTAGFGQIKSAKDGIVVNKTAKDNHDGTYTLTLESFVTGYKSNVTTHTVVNKAVPLDIVLVLDVSGSMDQNMGSTSTTTFTARNRQSYSYKNLNNKNYYYLHDDGNYYKVARNSYTINRTTHYYLSFYVESSSKTYYLDGTGVVEDRPSNYTKDSSDIWTGILYEAKTTTTTSTQTRIEALKEACGAFITNIASKASENNAQHQISLVKFAGDKTDAIGDDTQDDYVSGYSKYKSNYSQIVCELTDDYDAVSEALNGLSALGATHSDFGMELAQSIISNIPDERAEKSAKLVVMFTDGSPASGSSFSNTVANNAITAAKSMKDSGVKVYVVGTIASPSGNVLNYMNYVSSNYPNSTSMTAAGTSADSKYMMNTTDPSELTRIFQTISEDEGNPGSYTGGEDVDLEVGEVTINDVITPSFVLPDGASSVNVYALDCTGATKIKKDGKTYNNHPVTLVDDEGLVWYDENGFTWSTTKKTGVVASDDVSFVTNSDGFTTVSIENYDFASNWVGLKESIDIPAGSTTESIIADSTVVMGQKLVIEILVKPNPESEGGAVSTNDKSSGIYIGDQQVAIGSSPDVNFPVPATVYTPKNLEIQVSGLNEGETALFNVKCDAVNVDMVVAITGGISGSSTIAQLPVKKWNEDTQEYDSISYTVTEMTNWTWKYNNSSSKTQDLMEDNVFSFSVSENADTAAKAKNAEATKINIFTQTIKK